MGKEIYNFLCESLGPDGQNFRNFSLDCIEDPFDGVAKIRQCSHNFKPINWSSVAEAYEKGDLNIVMEVSSCRYAGNYELVVSRIPNGLEKELRTCGHENLIKRCFKCSSAEVESDSVLVACGFAQVLQNSGGVESIPSFFKLEHLKNRVEFSREVLSNSPTQVVFIRSNGKIEASRGVDPGHNFKRNGGNLIESMPHVVDCSGGDMTSLIRQWIPETKFMDLFPRIWVGVDHIVGWIGLKEGIADGFKFGQVRACLPD